MSYNDRYKIVESDRSSGMLAIEVNMHIRNGWEPLGGVCYNKYSQLTQRWSQAMVRPPVVEQQPEQVDYLESELFTA